MHIYYIVYKCLYIYVKCLYTYIYIYIYFKELRKLVIQKLNTFETKSIAKICLNYSVHLCRNEHHEMMEYIIKI